MDKKTRRLALTGIMVALAFIFSYLESLLPAFTGVPGVKPGLANITVMVAMYVMGPGEAAAIAAVRIILSGLAFSGLSGMFYSFAGATLSLAVMLLLKRTGRFSVTAQSIAGGVAHNIGQILLAWAILGKAVVYYLPVLLVSGAIAGLVTGIISALIIKRANKKP